MSVVPLLSPQLGVTDTFLPDTLSIFAEVVAGQTGAHRYHIGVLHATCSQGARNMTPCFG